MKAWLLLPLFFLFLIEGTVVPLYEPNAWGIDLYLIPRFVLVTVIFIALYMGRKYGLWLGFLFGLLQDILFSDVIGVYTFTMSFIGYFSGLAFLYFHPSLVLLMLTIMACVFLHEGLVYGFFSLFEVADKPLQTALIFDFLPTTLLNVLFALLIYVPLIRLLEYVREGMEREK